MEEIINLLIEQNEILKGMSSKMDDLNREMREVKVRLNEFNK